MTNQHPINPSPELIVRWATSLCGFYESVQWGADQELKACAKWIEDAGYHPSVLEDFLAARRPKPPSLKEQALKVLESAPLNADEHALIRSALEALPND